MSKDILIGLQDALCTAWDEMAHDGKIYIDPTLSYVSTTEEKVCLHSVPVDQFKPNSGDILVGFDVRNSAPLFKNDIRVEMGCDVLAQVCVIRGRKTILDQPLPLIGMQLCENISIVVNNGEAPYGIHVICAACSNKRRAALVQEKYVWGKWLYADGFVKAVDDATPDSLPRISVRPVCPSFGSVSCGISTVDEKGNLVMPDLEMYKDFVQNGDV